jgi:hypothetical protein
MKIGKRLDAIIYDCAINPTPSKLMASIILLPYLMWKTL